MQSYNQEAKNLELAESEAAFRLNGQGQSFSLVDSQVN